MLTGRVWECVSSGDQPRDLVRHALAVLLGATTAEAPWHQLRSTTEAPA